MGRQAAELLRAVDAAVRMSGRDRLPFVIRAADAVRRRGAERERSEGRDRMGDAIERIIGGTWIALHDGSGGAGFALNQLV